ncbi:aspartate 1-decarboxylase [uncultured Bradyrhizobium sp.]|uniref:aspartate 1-decarboxylase n=1 Tax=uncultured Bradyrhizobium sp. TaxID=199684 RepID=UPI0035CB413B
MRKVVAAKLHGLYVTDANLNYHGSITLDPEHCEAAGIFPLEFVDIWNKQSGARISTYVIFGERGSRVCCLNGAAARTCQAGDQVIICSSVFMVANEIENIHPRVLTFHPDNSIKDSLYYDVEQTGGGKLRFSIRDARHDGEALGIPLRAVS